MRAFVTFLVAVSVITTINAGYCLADINCQTAQQDIAAYEKQIADLQTKLLNEMAGTVPTSDYNGDGVVDPEKDREAGQTQQQDLKQKVAMIKKACGLGVTEGDAELYKKEALVEEELQQKQLDKLGEENPVDVSDEEMEKRQDEAVDDMLSLDGADTSLPRVRPDLDEEEMRRFEEEKPTENDATAHWE